MKVSVIATVLNEGSTIERLLESLAVQSRLPDEIVIADGGSTDGTIDILDAWTESGRLPLHVVSAPGTNISAGRNAAIAAANGDLIASTDAGVLLDRDWLAALVAPFSIDAAPTAAEAEAPIGNHAYTSRSEVAGQAFVAVVSGWFAANPQTLFETAMGATVLPHLREVKPARFLPSSRSVAFRRVAWEAVGGYPEWLDYCEDLVFDLRLKGLYGPFPFVPEAVAHFRPRRNLRGFARQYYQYARGDGKADLWRRRHAIRYLTYVLVAPGLLILAALHSPWWLLALLAGAAVYTTTPYRRLLPMLGPFGLFDRLKAFLWVPAIRVVGDVAKMIGYPVGLAWRWQNRRRAEVHWRQEVWMH